MKLELTELIKFEKKFDLKSRKILNLNYWDFCRMNIFYELRAKYEKTSPIADLLRKPTLKEKKIYLKVFSRYFINFRKNKNLDLLFIADTRRVKQPDGYESIFIDTIAHHLSKSNKIMTIEEPSWISFGYGMPTHFLPTNSVNLKYNDFYEFDFIIKRNVYKLLNRKKIKAIKDELNYLYTIIQNEFNVDISYTMPAFVNLILYFIIMGKQYKKLLVKLNPKIVLLNYRPTYFKMLINYVCRENNIVTVDLQHGVISKNDPLDRKNPDGYDLFTTSDYLFSFGEKLVNRTNLCFHEDSIKNIGFPFLEKKVNSLKSRPSMLDNKHKYILIISQSIMGEMFAKFASELASKLENDSEYKIIFKYHPNELLKDFKELKKDNIIEIKDLNYEIYQFQKYSCCQIGAYSTGLYEGLMFSLPTIILNDFPGSKGTIDNLSYIKQGVYVANSADDVVSILKKMKAPNKNDVNKLWQSNSLKNVEKEINEIKKKL